MTPAPHNGRAPRGSPQRRSLPADAWAPTRRLRVVGDGLRGVRQQPGAAHRGGRAAAGRGVGFARQLASAEELVEQWRLADPVRSSTVLRPVIPVAADGSSRPRGRCTSPDWGDALRRTIRRRSSSISTTSPAPSPWRTANGSMACSTSPRTGGCRGSGCVRSPANGHDFSLPERASEVIGRLRWRFQRGPIPPGLRSYTLEPWVVANGRLRDERLGTHGDQRAGVRRRHRVEVVDDDLTKAPPGVRPRHGCARRRPRDRGGRRDRPSTAAGDAGVCDRPDPVGQSSTRAMT